MTPRTRLASPPVLVIYSSTSLSNVSPSTYVCVLEDAYWRPAGLIKVGLVLKTFRMYFLEDSLKSNEIVSSTLPADPVLTTEENVIPVPRLIIK